MYKERYIQTIISESSNALLPKVGMIVLSTDFTCERDFKRLASRYDMEFDLYANRIHFENPMTRKSLSHMVEYLESVAADILPDCALDAILFNCTSASAILGDKAVSEAIGLAKPNTPVLTTAFASVQHILRAGHQRISLLAPYNAKISRGLADYFEHNGLDIVSLNYMGIEDDRDVARLNTQTIIDAASAAADEDAQALFISCTATRAAEILPKIQQAINMPVYSSNYCSFWQTMRIIGLT